MKKALIIAVASLLGLTACGVKKSRSMQTDRTGIHYIASRFQGSDGVTRRLYIVDLTVWPETDVAVLRVNGDDYELRSYVVASGYGYRNSEVDLRGKGDEATIDFADPAIRDLTLIRTGQEEK